MKDSSIDMYIARTQARLAYILILTLVLLCFGVVGILVIPTVRPNSEITGLIVQVVTGVLGLTGTAMAYFFARHRPPTAGDNETPSVSASTSPDGGSSVTVSAPLSSSPPENPK